MKPVDTCSFDPIGYVATTVADDAVPRSRRTMESTIHLYPQYAAGLTGIEAYSHLIVLFFMHRCPRPAPLTTHPRGDTSLPETGVFAGRGRSRPNPIGLAVVELLGVTDDALKVRRLDAYDGTPVIDIKPYDHYDVYADIRVPDWFAERAGRGR